MNIEETNTQINKLKSEIEILSQQIVEKRLELQKLSFTTKLWRKSHFKCGHPFKEGNVQFNSNGYSYCVICRKKINKENYLRRNEK